MKSLVLVALATSVLFLSWVMSPTDTEEGNQRISVNSPNQTGEPHRPAMAWSSGHERPRGDRKGWAPQLADVARPAPADQEHFDDEPKEAEELTAGLLAAPEPEIATADEVAELNQVLARMEASRRRPVDLEELLEEVEWTEDPAKRQMLIGQYVRRAAMMDDDERSDAMEQLHDAL